MEWEAAHSLAERIVWKDILEGVKGKNCYGSTFVLTGTNWQGTGLGKQKNNIVRKKTKGSIRKWEQLRHQPRQVEEKHYTVMVHGTVLTELKSRVETKFGFFFSDCKTDKKKLDKHANKTHQTTTRLVLTL